MKAIEEYKKWCIDGCGGYFPSAEAETAYVTGFNRAVELMEEYLKEKENE